MTEPGEAWRRFVAVDAVAAGLAAVLLWGLYGYWFATLYDFALLGVMVALLIDLCGLLALAAAAVLLLLGWRLRKRLVVLAGLAVQIAYGAAYGWLLQGPFRGGFITPVMMASVPVLALGLAGVFFYVATPKEYR